MRLLKIIRGSISAFCLFANLLLFSILTGLAGFIVWMIPWRPWRHYGGSILMYFPALWMTFNRIFMMISTAGKWNIENKTTLNNKKWYLLVCNHQSWFDILVLGCYFNYKIPPFKFFMKKELLWTLPLAGFVCYFLGYPFMRRHTASEIRKNPELKGRDIETTKKACEKFKEFPTTVMIFAEGTRFSEEKKAIMSSSYRHLLTPRAAGTAIVLNEMKQEIDGILNVTIDYIPEKLSMWKLICGDFNQLHLHYELLPLTENLFGDYYQDRAYRRHFTAWFNELWEEKDERLEGYRNGKEKPTHCHSQECDGNLAS